MVCCRFDAAMCVRFKKDDNRVFLDVRDMVRDSQC